MDNRTVEHILREEYERFENSVQDGAPSLLAIDTETTGVKYQDMPFAVTVAFEGNKGLDSYYFEVGTPQSGAVDWLLEEADTWVFHNAKFDLQKLLLAGFVHRSRLDEVTIHDTETIWHLINPIDRKGLKYLAEKLLGDSNQEEAELKSLRKKLKIRKDEGLHVLPREAVIPYAKMDADKTYRIFKRTYPFLLDEGTRLLDIYKREQELCLHLLDIEENGIAIDVSALEESILYYTKATRKLFSDLVNITHDSEFNPNSPHQVSEVLKFRGIDLPSTRKEYLNKVADDEFVHTLLEYRKHNKLLTAWLESLEEETVNGIYHPSFQPHTRTGRMSSRKQNE